MKIVEATEKQLHLIRNMAEIIWPYNYKNMISAAQIDYMLNLMYSDASLLEQMRNNHIFLLAEEKEQLVGFASYELHFENNKETRLHKIYVLPEIQGKGVGKKLLSEIIKIAQRNNDQRISLTVNRTNEALKFYQKLGFVITDSIDMPIGKGFYMEDYIMKKNI
jgi:ribosomal protein S18 acetylase RimI-like enzyme